MKTGHKKGNLEKPSLQKIKPVVFLVFSVWVIEFSFAQNSNESIEKSTIKGIHHVSLSVSDLEKSISFYTESAGIPSKVIYRQQLIPKEEKKSGFSPVPRKTGLLQGPNGYIEFIQFDQKSGISSEPMPVQGPGITHLCYQAPLRNSIYQKAKTLQASIISRGDQPVSRGYGIHYAYVRDRDGIMFEIEQLEQPTFKGQVWIGHVALAGPSLDRLVGFYTLLLGEKPSRRVDHIKNNPSLDDIANIDSLRLSGAWFKTGNMLLEIWQFDHPVSQDAKENPSLTKIGYREVAFETEDLMKEYHRLRKQGIPFLSEPIQTKEGWVVYLRDPDKNLISLRQFSPGSSLSLKKLLKTDD